MGGSGEDMQILQPHDLTVIFSSNGDCTGNEGLVFYFSSFFGFVCYVLRRLRMRLLEQEQ